MQRLLLSGILLFVFFFLLSIVIATNSLVATDWLIIQKIQSLTPDIFILPFSFFSLLGSAELATLILLAGMANFKVLRNIYVLGAYIVIGLIELIFKLLIDQIAPPLLFLKTHSFFHFPSGNIPQDFFSYPSGHTSRTAFISTLTILIVLNNKSLPKNLKNTILICIVVFDVSMFFSRVYLGEHWLTDVLGGFMLGTSFAILATYLSLRFDKAHTKLL